MMKLLKIIIEDIKKFRKIQRAERRLQAQKIAREELQLLIDSVNEKGVEMNVYDEKGVIIYTIRPTKKETLENRLPTFREQFIKNRESK